MELTVKELERFIVRLEVAEELRAIDTLETLAIIEAYAVNGEGRDGE